MNLHTTRLFDILMPGNIENLPEQLLRYKKNGEWLYYSPRTLKEMSFGLANYFVEKGYNHNLSGSPEEREKIGLICFSRPNWLVVDLASQLCGALLVPLYPNISASEIVTIFNETELRICFVGDMATYDKIQSIKDQIPSLEKVYVFDNPTPALDWKQLIPPFTTDIEKNIYNNASQIAEDFVSTIIYTSGTTGTPKGVMLTHKNILSNVKSATEDVIGDIQLPANKSLSFLPLNHILEKMIMYVYLYNHFSVSFAESIETIAANLQEVKPYIFVTVPRLLEKVYEKIISKGQALKGFKKSLFFWSVKLAGQYDVNTHFPLSYHIKLWIANRLIFSKWRAALGGNVKAIVVGGAACQQRLIRIFGAAQITILEGYGLTETSPVIAVNRFEETGRKIGTVGPLLKSVQLRFLEDGEICVKGDNVMAGYYKKPEETAAVMDDGWFKTGDIGMLDHHFLKITDRKKEIFKTSGGKFVVPQPIENKIKENFLIEQIMVVGEGQKFVSALIVPNFPALKGWCEKENIPVTDNISLLRNPKVIAHYQSIIDKYNPLFNHVEQVKKFVLLPHEWTVDGGELTPSVKIKRKAILKKYESEIDQLYGVQPA